jgi:hypothetical protein
MATKKEAGACDAGSQRVDRPSQQDNSASVQKSQTKISTDDGFVVNDGLRQIGLIRPHGSGFEVYANRGDELCYIARASTRAEALRLVREARR